MRLHLVVAAAAALVTGVVAQGCGGAPRCSPATCATGCCDSTGLCQSGNSTSACGARGNTCQPCGLGLSCIGGACMSLGTGAGSSGTGGGFSGTGGGSAAGGAAAGGSAAGGSAAGGSAAGGSAAGGDAGGSTAGGSAVGGGSTAGGSTAGGSTAGGSTAGGSTAGGSTAGGSTAGGSTAGGSTAGGSAAGGSAAGGSAVGGGSTAGGSAVGGGSTAGGSAGGGSAGGGSAGCGNCPTGCCQNGVCQTGTSPLACGSGGAQCQVCPLNTGCNNRMCTPCNATTCPNGCCDVNNTCRTGTTNLDCGLFGRACVSCGSPFGTSCQSQACVSTTNNGLSGSSCTSDLACVSGDGTTTGVPGSCIRATLDGGVSSPASGFPNGYCSPACPGGNRDCPAGTCLNVIGVNTCFANCPAPGQGRSTCRVGYVCDTLTDSASMMTLPFGICFPACTNAGVNCGGGTICNPSTGYCE